MDLPAKTLRRAPRIASNRLRHSSHLHLSHLPFLDMAVLLPVPTAAVLLASRSVAVLLVVPLVAVPLEDLLGKSAELNHQVIASFPFRRPTRVTIEKTPLR